MNSVQKCLITVKRRSRFLIFSNKLMTLVKKVHTTFVHSLDIAVTGSIMKTILIVLFFSIYGAFGDSPKQQCSPPKCAKDCHIDSSGPDCPTCVCTGKAQIACSTPKCDDKGCHIDNTGPDCPTCVCSKARKECSPPKCDDKGCKLVDRSPDCPECVCNKGKDNSTKCPDYECPGECAVGMLANGCRLCECPKDTKIDGGLNKELDATCLSTADCVIAYSHCKNNKCTCIDGFKPAKGLCNPPAQQCPTWKGQTKSDPGKACVHHFNQTTNEEIHTCDKSKEFCFVHPKEKTEEGLSVGHCCPKPSKNVDGLKMVCPYSISHNGTCPDLSGFPADAVIPENKQRTCSYITSECVHHFNSSVCCPLPCTGASSHFSVIGVCLDYVQIEQACSFSAQCIGGSTCMHQGAGKPLCRCPKKICYEPSEHCCDS